MKKFDLIIPIKIVDGMIITRIEFDRYLFNSTGAGVFFNNSNRGLFYDHSDFNKTHHWYFFNNTGRQINKYIKANNPKNNIKSLVEQLKACYFD